MVADATGDDDSKTKSSPQPKARSTPKTKPEVDADRPTQGSSVAPSLNRPSMPRPADVAGPALVVAKETLEAASGADSRPRLSLGTRAGAFAMLGVAAVAGAIIGLLAGDDDEGATT